MRPKRSDSQRGALPLALPAIILIGVLLLVVGIGIWMLIRTKNAKGIEKVPAVACGCKDINDIDSRMAEARAAITEYQTAIQEVRAWDRDHSTTTMYRDNFFQQEQANVQIAVNNAHKPGTHSVNGDTLTDCSTKVSNSTVCLKASAQTHENVHATTCQQKKAGKSQFANYKESMTLEQVYDDEIAGYSAEIKYLNENRREAKKDPTCGDWECDVDHKTYDNRPDCERGCRPTLGSTIKVGLRCTPVPK